MKKTKLLICTAFAAMSLTACGAFGGGSSSGGNGGELPKGGTVVDTTKEEGQQKVVESLSSALTAQETPFSANGAEFTLKSSGNNANFKVATEAMNIPFSLIMGGGDEGEDEELVLRGSEEEPTIAVPALDVNLAAKDFGGSVVAKVAQGKEYGSLSVKGTDLGGKLSLSGKLPAIALNMEAESYDDLIKITAKDVNKTQAVKANFSVYVSEEGNTYVDIADKNIDTTLNGLSKVANDLIKDLGYDQIINAFTAAFAEEGSEKEPASFEIDLLAMLNEAVPNRKFYTTGSQMKVSPTAWSLAGVVDPQYVSLLFPLLQAYQLDDNFQFTTYKDGGVGVKLSVNKADVVGTLALVANSMDDDTKAGLTMAGALIDALVENLNLELAVVLDKNGCISYVGESESLKVSGKLEDMLALTGAEIPFEIKGTFELGCTTSVSVNAKYSNSVKVDVPSDLSKYVLLSNAE